MQSDGDILMFHRSNGQEGTIDITKVEDPSRCCVIVFEENGKRLQVSWREATDLSWGDGINAGIYIDRTRSSSSMVSLYARTSTSQLYSRGTDHLAFTLFSDDWMTRVRL